MIKHEKRFRNNRRKLDPEPTEQFRSHEQYSTYILMQSYIRQLKKPKERKITVIGYKMNNKKKTKNPQYRSMV